jgi:SAM-dependent methyltransferase
MDLKETAILGADIAHHWYYQAKLEVLIAFLGRPAPVRILDVGAGSGFFARRLLERTAAREAWCVDPGYAADRDERQSGKPIHFRRRVGAVDADLVLLMDVLEHVDHDAALLAEYAGKVPSGCRFLITVPAFQWLWSGHDVFLGHRRRYTLPEIEAAARRAGLRVESGAYCFAPVFPMAAALRMASRISGGGPPRSQLTRHCPMVNRTLKWLCRLERPVMRLNRVAGLTALCRATRV